MDRLLSVSLDVTVQLTYMNNAWLEAGGRHWGRRHIHVGIQRPSDVSYPST